MREIQIVQVCEVITDVDPAYVSGLLDRFSSSFPENVVDAVVQTLFDDTEKSYPKKAKLDAKQKGKCKADGGTVDYSSTDRVQGGGVYRQLAHVGYISFFWCRGLV